MMAMEQPIQPLAEIPPERATDVVIARRLFGIAKVYQPYPDSWLVYIPSGKPWRTHSIDARPLPFFSTDIAAAWQVVERLGVQGWHARLVTPFQPGSRYFCGFTPHSTTGWNGRPDHEAGADTMPLAICTAALAVLGPEPPARRARVAPRRAARGTV